MKENLKFFIAVLLWVVTFLPLCFLEINSTTYPLGWNIYVNIISIFIHIAVIRLYHTLVSKVFDMVEAEEKLKENGK